MQISVYKKMMFQIYMISYWLRNSYFKDYTYNRLIIIMEIPVLVDTVLILGTLFIFHVHLCDIMARLCFSFILQIPKGKRYAKDVLVSITVMPHDHFPVNYL